MKIRGIIKITFGHIVAKISRYDKRYLEGKWFSEDYNYVGWNWVFHDSVERVIFHHNKSVPWPISSRSQLVGKYTNIEFSPDDLNNFQHFGCYFQAKGKIKIGHGTYIAPNVGIITANHNINNLDINDPPKDVIIGENCWIGMNSVILPGVVLGNGTVVGAGAVVTKSFIEGHCVIAGVPAKKIKDTI